MNNQGDALGEILGIDEIDTLVDIEFHRLFCHRVPHRRLHGNAWATGNRIITIDAREPQQRQFELVLRRIGFEHMLAGELRSVIDATPAVERRILEEFLGVFAHVERLGASMHQLGYTAEPGCFSYIDGRD